MSVLPWFARHCHLRPSVIALAALLSLTVPVGAQQRVFNTGVGANGAPLAGGSSDPHWQLVGAPGGITVPAAAFVVNDQDPQGGYFEALDARWIWFDASGVTASSMPFTFRHTFDLTGLDPSMVSISGLWGVDDTNGAITLNGAMDTLGTGLELVATSFEHFGLTHPFSITGGFRPGLNFIEVTASNQLGLTGAINVSSVTLIPEPSTYLMMIAGLGTIALLARRQSKRRDEAA